MPNWLQIYKLSESILKDFGPQIDRLIDSQLENHIHWSGKYHAMLMDDLSIYLQKQINPILTEEDKALKSDPLNTYYFAPTYEIFKNMYMRIAQKRGEFALSLPLPEERFPTYGKSFLKSENMKKLRSLLETNNKSKGIFL